MDCKTIMTTPPTRLRTRDTVDDAIHCLLDNHMYCVPVVDDDEVLVGQISVARLTELLLPSSLTMEHALTRVRFVRETLPELRHRLEKCRHRPIGEVMEKDVAFVHPGSPLIDALVLLKERAVRVPVVEPASHRLVGGISFLTLLRAVEAAPSDPDISGEGEPAGGDDA